MLDHDETRLNLELNERQMTLHERQMTLYERSWALHEKRLGVRSLKSVVTQIDTTMP
jgi:hypothetical protein